MDLYIYQNFNNYFNKIIKRFETLAKYGSPHFIQANVNFKPNDGVNTTLIVGAKESYDGSGDYLLVINDKNINSRWFILDQSRNREGQFSVTLRRDLIADFYEPFMNNSMIYLEKGWINNVSNPLLFNDEGFKPNQIKQNETLLMDKSKCKWLIGYVDKKAGDTKDADTGVTTNAFWNGTEMRTEISGNIRVDLEVSSWANWNLYKFINGSFTSVRNIQTTLRRTYYGTQIYDNSYTANKNGYVSSSSAYGDKVDSSGGTLEGYGKTWASKYVANYDKIESMFKSLNADMTNKQYEELLALNGKTIYSVQDQAYIKLSAIAKTPYGKSETVTITASNEPTAHQELEKITKATWETEYNVDTRTYAAFAWYGHIQCSYQTISTPQYKNYKWGTDSKGHAHLVNEAYDMFALPIVTQDANTVRLWDGSYNENGQPNYEWIGGSEQAAFIIAQHLIQKAGSGGYDLQLVPFAPLEDSLIERDSIGTIIRIDDLIPAFDFSIAYDDANIAHGCIFWITRNSFSHTLDYSIANETDAIKIKEANQLDLYRLSSGDYSSQFEFSPIRNRGVSKFEADCTYKPYAPYIRVCPLFNENGLYGQDWNDTRGLVCSNTNYSISRGGDAWATFERNNLNYQNAWKREVDYMDQMHVYDRANNIIGGIIGAAGAGAGIGIATNRLGAGIGAGVASLGAGVADVLISEHQYQLNRDNQIAAHNEQMANVKAQPDTLVATGANTINNKVFPILIYYSCTTEERALFNLQLDIYGMTINCVVDNLNDYLNNDTTKPTYIKGQLIRLENIAEDNHLVYEIAQELMRGIYLKGAKEE